MTPPDKSGGVFFSALDRRARPHRCNIPELEAWRGCGKQPDALGEKVLPDRAALVVQLEVLELLPDALCH